jgi:polygalacturonase
MNNAIAHVLYAFLLSSHAIAMITPYPAVPGDEANGDYLSVKVNGVTVPAVTTAMNVGYAHFAFTGKVKVEITAKEPITTFDLSPHRLGIKAAVSDRVLSFELDRPRKLHLRINKLSRFFLFSEAPEVSPPQPGQAGVVSVADFGVTSSPDQTQTAAMQRAIDEAAAQGTTLVVPAGIYRAGRLDLKSNLKLYLAPGAIIKGTGVQTDYPKTTGGTQQIHIGSAENVHIFGRGVIDGNGQALRKAGNNVSASKAKLIVSNKANNLVIDDVLLREAGVWCVHLIESSDIRVSNAKLISMTRAEAAPGADEAGTFYGGNTDGFDPDNTSRVTIENCFISVDDDPIAVKLRNGTRRDMEDITFRNNVVWTMCSALKIGTEVNEKTLRNVTFENNDVVHADVGIAVWCWRGGSIDGARWINNHFESIGGVKKEGPNAKTSSLRLTIRDVEGKGRVRNLLIKDNTFENFSPSESVINGLDAEHMFENVVIENLVIAKKRRITAEEAQVKVGEHTRNITIR